MIFTPDHQSGWSLRPQRPSAPPLRGFFRRLVSSSRAPSPSLPSHPCRKLFHSAARPLPVKSRLAGIPVRLNPLRSFASGQPGSRSVVGPALSRFAPRSQTDSAAPAGLTSGLLSASLRSAQIPAHPGRSFPALIFLSLHRPAPVCSSVPLAQEGAGASPLQSTLLRERPVSLRFACPLVLPPPRLLRGRPTFVRCARCALGRAPLRFGSGRTAGRPFLADL